MKQLLRAGLLVIATGTFGLAGSGKLAPDLNNASPDRQVDVIVQYRVAPTAAHHNRVAARGGALHRKLDFIHGAHYRVPASAVRQLAADPDVAYVTPDRPVKGMLNVTSQAVNSGIANQSGYDGTGIGVAVLDSGIHDLPDFHTKVNRNLYSASFITGGNGNDQYGHGTHVTGILGANGNGTAYIGVAPNVNFVDLQVLDKNGNGTDSSVIAAIQAAIQLKSQYNIRVMNLSLGRPVFEAAAKDPLCQAVEQAWRAGIVVVVAAGNGGRDNFFGTGGYGTISAPGNDPYVITVGAMKPMGTPARTDDVMASYSSKGPDALRPLCKAGPGRAGQPRGFDASCRHDAFANVSPERRVRRSAFLFERHQHGGAGGQRSGCAVDPAEPEADTGPAVKVRLMQTASKAFPLYSTSTDPATGVTVYNIQNDVFTVGAGYLDIWAALTNTTAIPAWARPPCHLWRHTAP